MWQLSHPDHPHKSYLFGTIHVRDRRAFFRCDEVIEKVQACDVFASEVDLDELSSAGVPDYFFLPEGQSVRENLGERRFLRGQKILNKAFGVDLSAFDQMLPFLTINAVSLECLNSEEPMPLDLYLWTVAKSIQKETTGLETIQDQADLLGQIPVDWQFLQLKDMLTNVSGFRKSVRNMLECYVRQDTMKLYQSSKKKMGSIKDQLIYIRNEKMSNRLFEIHKSQSILAAIGAGHLSGQFGMISLLRKKGFKVQPI